MSANPNTPIRPKLSQIFTQALRTLGLDETQAARFGEVTVSDRPDLAHYQCNGALPVSKMQKQSPREFAQKLLNESEKLLVAQFGAGTVSLSIAGPGFINLKFSDLFLAGLCAQANTIQKTNKPKTIVIDLGSPNVAKSMHAGHLRSLIIGDSIQRILRLKGHNVIADDHLGDWGTPMGMIICALQDQNPALPYFDPAFSGSYPKVSPVTMEDLGRIYPEASKRFKADSDFENRVLRATDELQKGRKGYKALWQHFVDTTLADLNRDFKSLGIHFDKHLGESFYEDLMPPMVERLKKQGHTIESEGALVIELADEKDPEMPPLILVKTGGGFLYHTSDLATIEYRKDVLKADTMVYVVDKRQSLHFKQVFKAARKTGLAGSCELIHTGFGTMNGKDGKPFKTREGGTIKLSDLISMVTTKAHERLSEMGSVPESEKEQVAHKVGMATLKYADLKNSRTADYIFDLDRFSQFEGNTGPYLLYAAVRIQSILRKAEAQGFKPSTVVAPTLDSERALMLELLKLSDYFEKSCESYEPHHLCDFGFTLSQVFNHFYKECHIMGESDPARRGSWLSLCEITLKELKMVLSLIGVDVPERM